MTDRDEQESWEKAYLELLNDATVGRLFRGVIHNLNGLVQAISMQSELLDLLLKRNQKLLDKIISAAQSSEPEETVKLRELYDRCLGGIGQINDRVRDIQFISRRSGGAACFGGLENSDDSADVINEIIKGEIEFLNADKIFKHKVKKILKLHPELPRLHMPGMELRRVVFMLLTNSLEAMAAVDNATVEIETHYDHGKVVLSIIDNGCGIAETDLPHIFKPFFTTKKNHHGLGLYLARKTMSTCGGEISCLNSKAGATHFVVVFPAVET